MYSIINSSSAVETVMMKLDIQNPKSLTETVTYRKEVSDSYQGIFYNGLIDPYDDDFFIIQSDSSYVEIDVTGGNLLNFEALEMYPLS